LEDDKDKEPSKVDKFLDRILGDKLQDVLIYISVIFSIIFSVFLFMVLPNLVASILPLTSQQAWVRLYIMLLKVL